MGGIRQRVGTHSITRRASKNTYLFETENGVKEIRWRVYLM